MKNLCTAAFNTPVTPDSGLQVQVKGHGAAFSN